MTIRRTEIGMVSPRPTRWC